MNESNLKNSATMLKLELNLENTHEGSIQSASFGSEMDITI